MSAVEGIQEKVQRALDRLIAGPYRRTLEWALEWRYATVAIAIASLILTASIVAGAGAASTRDAASPCPASGGRRRCDAASRARKAARSRLR